MSFVWKPRKEKLSGIEIKDGDFIVLPALALAIGVRGSSRGWKSCSLSHAFLNPEQSNYIFRRNHLEDNQFHCKSPGIQQLNIALVGMTSLKLCLCCCVTHSVYYNLVAGTIWLSAYCVQSPVAGCCHHGCVTALWWEAGLEVGFFGRWEIGDLAGGSMWKKFLHNSWVDKWLSSLHDSYYPECFSKNSSFF